MANANGHGGARPGAGRKPKAERFASKIAAAEKQFADHLTAATSTIIRLAEGGIPVVEEKWEPAGLVLIDVVVVDDDGKATRGKRLAFPDREPEDLVLVERKTSTLAPDLRANVQVLDRILGRPTQAVEVTGQGGGPVEVVQFYLPSNGRDDAQPSPAEAPRDPAQ